jgi:long-chain acyl-CoA synthetase
VAKFGIPDVPDLAIILIDKSPEMCNNLTTMLNFDDYILQSIWSEFPEPNFVAWLESREQYAGKTAILFRGGKQKEFTVWTYRRFIDECKRIARGLLACGLKKGDRVILWAENRPEWMAAWVGIIVSGCIVVPADFLQSDEECLNIIKFTNAKAGFFSARKNDFAESLETNGVHLKSVIITDAEFSSFGTDAASNAAALPTSGDIKEDDPCSIVFTSGTTGFAKGVTLKHKGIIANVCAAILQLKPTRDDVFINVLPLHHTYPTTCSFLAPLSCGIPAIIVERLVGEVVVNDIRDGHGTFLIAVPLLYDKFMSAIEDGYQKTPAPVRAVLDILRGIALKKAKAGNWRWGQKVFRFIRKKAGLDSIEIMVAGGGALNPRTADFFDSLGFNIVHGYGMSENSPLISVNTPEHKRNASVGLPVNRTEVKIVDQNDENRELPIGESGEIIVKSPSLMLGYYENREATREMFTSDGWLKTGDLGYIDNDGFIYINGRKKNLIVSSGGKNIYPEEIENHFARSRVIGEILVLGRRDPLAGESIFAVVVPNFEALQNDFRGAALDDDFIAPLVKKEIMQVNRELSAYKKIADFMLRREPFEKNAQQKIRRFLYNDYADPSKTSTS